MEEDPTASSLPDQEGDINEEGGSAVNDRRLGTVANSREPPKTLLKGTATPHLGRQCQAECWDSFRGRCCKRKTGNPGFWCNGLTFFMLVSKYINVRYFPGKQSMSWGLLLPQGLL